VLKRYDGETLRFFMLRTHYRSPFNFSDGNLDDARSACAACTPRWTARATSPTAADRLVRAAGRRFKAAMDDDFNTPGRVAVLFELAGEVNRSRARDSRRLLRRWAARWACCSSARATTCRPAPAWTRRRSRR
jgi:cysteinyl-tRNA synthetase